MSIEIFEEEVNCYCEMNSPPVLEMKIFNLHGFRQIPAYGTRKREREMIELSGRKWNCLWSSLFSGNSYNVF